MRGVLILTCCLYRPMVLQKQQGKQVNRAGLSEIFGVALPMVDQWARNGCPVVKRGGRGREWTFDTAVVARWLRDKAAEEAAGGAVADIEEWKRRKIAAEAQREELHLADAKKQVAPLEQVEKTLARVFAEVRANLRTIPGRTVALLLGETDERRYKRVLLQEIDQTLENLASLDLTQEDTDPDEDEETGDV
ncbi:terminase small subunit [Xylella fastidiosa]|uniref:terminase small subunit n=1 Tax=Xylella fastidiosa TaxID=2371 RepID=UPI00056DD0BD|nr:terminase small subunit [Xylella fastidiosa]